LAPAARPVVVTGAGGRLGSSIVAALERAGWLPIAWTRSDLDLDNPAAMSDIARLAPSFVVHAAAWTDVEGCARDPDLALRRNGEATREIARACAASQVPLVLISTNEVFDGERTDGCGYRPEDTPNPMNAYGVSKLAGERWAAAELQGGALWIVRTAWLFGVGKPDFPAKIAAAARTARAEGRPLRVVADEIGTPTYVPDLASAIIRLMKGSSAGTHHVVNGGRCSRATWARAVLAHLGIQLSVEDVTLAEFERASSPPRWGVLEPTDLPGGLLRTWEEAMVDRAAELQRSAA
jgi:dTDP-4-dehydrorhamnose reductase